MYEKIKCGRSMLARVAMALFFLAGWTSQAQLSGKGEVRGTVTDPQGAVIPGAVVTATKLATGVATETKTTSAGDYSLPALDPGEYKVVISAPGFAKVEQQHVQVNALESVSVNPRLTVGGDTQTVTVSTEPPQLETSNATLGATIEHEMYEALPIEMGAYGQADQRRATDFAFLMPGVQGNNTTGNATTNAGIVNGSGSRGGVTGIYVDGVVFVRAGGNGDPRFVWTAISVDAVDQFQLQTSGYSAIYEGQGIQNYTIKQGGNKYHGQVYEFFRNTALDTWGFFGANTLNPFTNKPQKPLEHSNEYGINLSGPLLPFGRWKEKIFAFANYNGFRYASQTPTQNSFPNSNNQGGIFTGVASGGIFDPTTVTSCTAHNGGFPCRYRYGFGPGALTAQNVNNPGNALQTGTPDQIPASEFSMVALNLQRAIPALTSQNLQLNYIAPNATALTNWSHTERVDWIVTDKDTVTLVAAIGRQASSNPVGQATAGRNVGPGPYNYGQAYAPKTAVALVEETHTFTPHVINQLKYGFARYNGPTFNYEYQPQYSAATFGGIAGLPVGQAAGAFPIVTFTGNNAPTNWAGTTANVVIAQNFTLVDNLQWTQGAHSLTFGGQIAWMQYLNQPATGGSTPLTLAANVNSTAQFAQTSGKVNYGLAANTGSPYASFLIGQFNSTSLTQYNTQEFSSRFRAVSPYVQDTWRATSRLTLDLGLRWDYFPPVKENLDRFSFFNPNLANNVTGISGNLQLAGHGAGTCNCDTPINTYWKNFSPRVGFAFQSDEKTVWRGSFGIMFTHGNLVGGGNGSVTGNANVSNGFTTNYTTAVSGVQDGTVFGTTNNNYSSAPSQVNGYTRQTGYTGAPSAVAYIDPYLGGRAPEFVNWSFGFQHSWTPTFTSSISYVGSQGHFLQADGSNARGYYSNGLDPKFLGIKADLSDADAPLTGGTALTTYCSAVATAGNCPSYFSNFNTTQSLATLLKPFPFQNVSDLAGNVANASYHALQTTFNMRNWHRLTFMANYTWSRSIDDGGTFRTGYAIPQSVSNTDRSWAPDRIERSVSTSNQPQHVVVTGVYDLPFGREILAHNAAERAIFGGFKFSTIFQAYSGSPLAITGASCATNQAQITCMPNYAGNFPRSGQNVRINGKYGAGVTRTSAATTKYIDSNAFAYAPAYTFGNLARTAAYNLYGPGNYQLDISLRRSFKLHLTEASRFNFQADLYNVTNHTFFAIASTVYGNASFGTLTTNANYNRRAAQLSARLEF